MTLCQQEMQNSTVGFGFDSKFNKKQGFSIPISFNLSTGLEKKNHFEVGLGLTYSESKTGYNQEKIIEVSI